MGVKEGQDRLGVRYAYILKCLCTVQALPRAMRAWQVILFGLWSWTSLDWWGAMCIALFNVL